VLSAFYLVPLVLDCVWRLGSANWTSSTTSACYTHNKS